jgi:hypothetical protein
LPIQFLAPAPSEAGGQKGRLAAGHREKHNAEMGLTIYPEKNIICPFDRSLNFSVVKNINK